MLESVATLVRYGLDGYCLTLTHSCRLSHPTNALCRERIGNEAIGTGELVNGDHARVELPRAAHVQAYNTTAQLVRRHRCQSRMRLQLLHDDVIPAKRVQRRVS